MKPALRVLGSFRELIHESVIQSALNQAASAGERLGWGALLECSFFIDGLYKALKSPICKALLRPVGLSSASPSLPLGPLEMPQKNN